MNTPAFIRWMIETLSKDMADLAASMASSALSHDEYLISVGKYRQMKAIVQKLRDRLAKDEASFEEEPEDLLPAPSRMTPSEPERKNPKRSSPRSWGGGR